MKFLKLILIILFVGCLFNMPYGYFQLVRFAGMALFFLFAYQVRDKRNKTFMIMWLLCGVLLNPFIKIALGRTIWNIVDVILTLILIYSIWKDGEERGNKKDKTA